MSQHTEALEDARVFSLQGDYEAALRVVNDVLQNAPGCVDALRLKGNVLELKAFDESEHSSKPLALCADYIAARECYEAILSEHPENVLAHLDLADHFKNLDAFDKALQLYASALTALQATSVVVEQFEEIAERLSEFPASPAYNGRLQELKSVIASMGYISS
jgi:tetratricopeptide (TPR) repeat protein